MNLLKEYFDFEAKIHKYFGYKEDWVKIPFDDCTGKYWAVIQGSTGGGSVFWLEDGVSPSREVIESGHQMFGGIIYTQRFLPKWVYRADEHTMVCVDTQCDGNKFLMIFDNDKEIKDKELKDTYVEWWITRPEREFQESEARLKASGALVWDEDRNAWVLNKELIDRIEQIMKAREEDGPQS